MTKGVSIKFKSYKETIPKLLHLLKFDEELKKHKKIIIKPHLGLNEAENTPSDFTAEVLNYCLRNKSHDTEIFIAEGSDGADTMDLFSEKGYKSLAENNSVGLIDLNTTDEVEEVQDGEFLKFQSILYPKILMDSFIISLPKLAESSETDISASLSNMLGAYPSKYYRGFFSSSKSKIRKFPIKYAIHDILQCRMPQFTLIDASDKGVILAGKPLDMDIQAAKLLGKDYKMIPHLRLVEESFSNKEAKAAQIAKLKEERAKSNSDVIPE